MSYIKKVVSRHTTEYGFISEFITSLTAADERISCLTADLGEQFENDSSSPCFSISIAGVCTLTFTRVGLLSYTDYCYSVTDQNGIVTGTLYFANSPLSASDHSKRSWKYTVAANEGIINLSLYSFYNEIDSPEISCTVIVDDDNACYGIAEDKTSAIAEDMIDGDSVLFAKQDRLPYIFSSEGIVAVELIRNKVFTDAASGVRAFVTDKLFVFISLRIAR